MQAAPEFWSSFGIPAETAAELEGQWVISYPVELTNDEGSSSGKVSISRFGEAEDISAPSDAVDLAALVGA